MTALAYANAAPKVLLYDDQSIISQNRLLTGVRDIPALFRHHARAGTGDMSRLYRPVAMATLALDRSLYGGNARGYHVSSIAYHVGATALLFALLLGLGVPRQAAFVAALVFGVHPLHTDAVDSAFNRSEVLAAAGVFGGLAWLWRFAAAPRLGARALGPAALIYFAALLCRESAVTLPVLAALMLALLRPRPTWRDEVRRLLPLALLAVPLGGYLGLRQLALTEPGGGVVASLTQGLAAPGALGARLSLVAVSARDYLKLTFYPSPLRASYEDYVVTALGLAVAVHLALLALAVAARRRAPLVTVAVACYYVALLPSTKVFADPAAFAERFAYLPSAGVVLGLAAALTWLQRRHGPRPVLLAGVALAGALLPLTLVRNLDWHSKRALWEADVKVTRDDWRSLINLSEAYLSQGRNDRVLALCQRGHEVAPQHGGFYSNQGVALINLGRYDEAEAAFHEAVRRDPSTAHWSNLARLYAMRRRFEAAELAYQRAVQGERDPASRHALEGELLLRLYQDGVGARTHFEEALRLEPRLNAAREGLVAAERVFRARRAAGLDNVSVLPRRSQFPSLDGAASAPASGPAAAPPSR